MSVETRPAPLPRINGGQRKPSWMSNLSGRVSGISGRRILLIVGAGVAGLWVASAVFRQMAQPPKSAAAPVSQVVVTARGVDRGTILTNDDVHAIAWPYAAVPVGAFQDVGALLGRSARTQLPPHTPVLESSLLPANSGAPLAASIPAGYRAIGISIDPRDGMHRWLSAGDHVDVVTTVDGPHATLPSSRILLQDVEVLALSDPNQANGQTSSGRDAMTVTLGVLPTEAEKLTLGMRIGTLQLLLRHPDDSQAVATSGVTSDTLLPEGGSKSTEALTYRSVELIAGRARTLQRFHTDSGLAATPLEASNDDTGEPE